MVNNFQKGTAISVSRSNYSKRIINSIFKPVSKD